MKRSVHVLVFDGLADWEAALAMAEIRNAGHTEIVTVGFDSSPVVTMGGLKVVPDTRLSNLNIDKVRMLIIPGGDLWARGDYPMELDAKLHELRDVGVPIAAICGGTVVLARSGLLKDRAHTSNDRAWLQSVAPNYAGNEKYENQLAVRDRGIITATGTAPTDFARAILDELEIYAPEKRSVWFELYKTGAFPKGADVAAYFSS